MIERVAPRSAGAAAGLQPGDVIVSWSSPASPPALPRPAGGEVRSPYDLLPAKIEELPRRAVFLTGRREGRQRTWALQAGDWGIEARPGRPAPLLTTEGSWRSAAASARAAGDGRLAAWFLDRLAESLAKAGRWREADAAFQEALAALEEEPDSRAAAALLRAWGETFQRRGDWDAAAERYRKALDYDRKSAPQSLAAALTLSEMAVVLARQGDYAGAERLLRQGLAIRQELAPGSTEVAASLNRLGVLARVRGDLSAAESYLVRAEELQRRRAPDNSSHALIILNLGNVAQDRGDLRRAEALLRKTLAIWQEVNPQSEGVAGCLQNLAVIAIYRGNLAEGDDLLRRSLALQQRRAPDALTTFRTLILLGHLDTQRGDLKAAEAHFRRALALSWKLSPEGPEAALSLGRLGDLALSQGDFGTAGHYLRRVLEIQEKMAPGSPELADSLEDLARLHIESGGDLAEAERLLRRALAIFEDAGSLDLEAAAILHGLGEVALRQGRPEEAVALHRRALQRVSRVAPGSREEAGALHFLGRAEQAAGRPREGLRDLCRAVDVLDAQRARLGGTPEAKAAFESTLGDDYNACLEALIEAGRPAEALHVLERGRARSFLALLAERDLRLSDLPPQLAAERRRANAEYDRVQSQLAALSADRDAAEIERLTGELRDLRTRQEEISARIRRQSPRSAALENPEPLDLAGVRRALDPGTVLLEYSVGTEKTFLFVVQAAAAEGPGLAVFPVAAGAGDLHAEVESFRRLLKNPGSDLGQLQAQARRLYDRLVRPAERQLAGARRVLVSSDRPLHTLPFAALMREDRYLIEWKPIHSVLSATVYAELVKARRPPGASREQRLAAFGNPVYPPPLASAPADPEVRETVRRGLALQPLPFSGREVRSIAALYPQARVYLGRDATEERAKSLGPEERLVHFACHGVLDERFPLNSALALTLPERGAAGRDNGLLQAWEIFESLRLDADLVTLSACDTALGKEMAGEGLVGLTRAFQYAGARSVLATLWGVSDRSTARWMERFYSHLRAGKSKDEALRQAQIDQIHDRAGATHPFHWAAFQLTGDWR